MEHLQFDFPGDPAAPAPHPHGPGYVLVGVVSSGNLEVLLEPATPGGGCRVRVATSVAGYGAVWRAVLAEFCARHRLRDLTISINDMGATPAVVSLRLDQAFEELERGAAR